MDLELVSVEVPNIKRTRPNSWASRWMGHGLNARAPEKMLDTSKLPQQPLRARRWIKTKSEHAGGGSLGTAEAAEIRRNQDETESKTRDWGTASGQRRAVESSTALESSRQQDTLAGRTQRKEQSVVTQDPPSRLRSSGKRKKRTPP